MKNALTISMDNKASALSALIAMVVLKNGFRIRRQILESIDGQKSQMRILLAQGNSGLVELIKSITALPGVLEVQEIPVATLQ